jgi:hypothetical protein
MNSGKDEAVNSNGMRIGPRLALTDRRPMARSGPQLLRRRILVRGSGWGQPGCATWRVRSGASHCAPACMAAWLPPVSQEPRRSSGDSQSTRDTRGRCQAHRAEQKLTMEGWCWWGGGSLRGGRIIGDGDTMVVGGGSTSTCNPGRVGAHEVRHKWGAVVGKWCSLEDSWWWHRARATGKCRFVGNSSVLRGQGSGGEQRRDIMDPICGSIGVDMRHGDRSLELMAWRHFTPRQRSKKEGKMGSNGASSVRRWGGNGGGGVGWADNVRASRRAALGTSNACRRVAARAGHHRGGR